MSAQQVSTSWSSGMPRGGGAKKETFIVASPSKMDGGRLGLAAQLTGGMAGGGERARPTAIPDASSRQRMPRRFESPRRFPDSSHGSDTGTASTRESECSEDQQQHSPTGPVSPLISQSKLYDSLAAELREKLSGGVPLLLPAKDYGAPGDKHVPSGGVQGGGDGAARRGFRSGGGGGGCLTGTSTPSTGGNQKHGVSSRGSSGIGSDLAPSPERHEPQSSSEDEWVNDQEPVLNGSPHARSGGRPMERYLHDDPPAPRMASKYRDQPPVASSAAVPPTTYLYPNVREEPVRVRQQRSSSREEDRSLQGSVNSREEEVRPIITNHTPRYRNAFQAAGADGYGGLVGVEDTRKKKLTIEEKYGDDRRDGGRRGGGGGGRYPGVLEGDDRVDGGELEFEYGKPHAGRYFEEEYERERYRENLTDRQKYREIVTDGSKYHRAEYDRRAGFTERADFREYSPERVPGRAGKYAAPEHHFVERQDFKVEREGYHRPQVTRSPPMHKPDARSRYPQDPDLAHDLVDRRPVYRGGQTEEMDRPAPELYRDEGRYRASNEEPMKRGIKHADKYEERWRHGELAVTDRYGDADTSTSASGRRYHREEPKHAQPQPAAVEPRKKSVEIRTSSPESTMHRISPKDRFQTAKEKFQQMERERHEQERLEQERLERERMLHSKRAVEHVVVQGRRGSLEPAAVSSHESNGWSSEEDELPPRGLPTRSNGSTGGVPTMGSMGHGYRELTAEERFPGLDREPNAARRMMPAKSLTNLVKGYRHSYAEPRPPPVSRSSGRVGLAAVNPY
uniref:Uncharacterized protein n=1 Tax=Anopheles atroparvus TaxID=41427 RepID=A0A182J844_ANOAO